MNERKQIVLVNANFARGNALFNYLKKYSQESSERFVYWDEFAFSVEPLPESDAVLVFNQPSDSIETHCDPGKTIAFMMEPGDRNEHPWMFRQLDRYAVVYSPINRSANTILSHGFLGWMLNGDRNFLADMPVPEKTKAVSCIASNLTQLKGHNDRVRFVNELKKQLPAIDFFGKGSNYLPDKMDGLRDYYYSIAIENSSAPYYFTEKINDCFLAYTVPVYHGCKNIGKFFPAKAFIQIDINDSRSAMRQIRECLFRNDWPERLEALKEARELVLNKYQPLAGAATALRNIQPSGKKNFGITPVTPSLKKRISNAWFQFKHAGATSKSVSI